MYLSRVEAELQKIRDQHRYREIGDDQRAFAADFSSNDYLGLSADSRMLEALKIPKRVGSGGSRLLGGRHREHRLLEEDLAKWTGRERALLFSSGYLAAFGAIAVLGKTVDSIYSDSLNHASLVDAMRTFRVRRIIYPHLQLPPKEERRTPALVVTESYFGMDGDQADLQRILDDLHDDDVLLIDEAHALGVFGEQGGGLAHGMSDQRIVVLGTLSKAVGAAGGFIAGPAPLIELLVNTARTFIYDTALPPPIAFAARVGVMLARNADDARTRLLAKADRLRRELQRLGLLVLPSSGPVVPVMLGTEERALTVMRKCQEAGINAPAIRPPTVPPGSSRLRLSVRDDHSTVQIDRLIETLACIVSS